MASNADWDSKTVIGFKAKAPKVARNAADLNGTSLAQPSFSARSCVFFPAVRWFSDVRGIL